MDEQVFNKCSVILFHSLDVSTISPYLVKHQLVTESDSEKFDNPYISDVDKIDYLIQILPSKGNCWLEKFIQCLDETSEGTGHCKIVKELKRAKQRLDKTAKILEIPAVCYDTPSTIIQPPPLAELTSQLEELITPLEAGVPLDLDFDTSAAGGGQLDAICVGKTVGEVPVKVEAGGEDKYKILFTPPAPDMDEVSVKWGGEHIKGSPFKINMLKPEATEVKVVSLPLASIETGNALVLGFDMTEAGSGQLEAEPERVPVANQPLTDDASKPIEPEVIQQLDEDTVQAESPGILEETPVPEFVYGQAVDLDITSSGAKLKDITSHAVHEDTQERVKVTVKKLNKEQFRLSLKPKHPGIYNVHVLLNREEIPASPYKIKYCEPFDVKAVRVTLLDSEPYTVGEHIKITVDCKEAGKGDISIKAVGPSFGTKPKCEITDNKDGTYSVLYVPVSTGKHKIEITESGKAVAGTPIKFKVVQNIAERVRLCKPPSSTLDIGSEISLGFDTSKAGDGKMSASCTSEKSGDVTCNVTVRQSESYVNFTPLQPDIYHVDVKWSGVHIPGSPFRINLIPPIANDVKLLAQPKAVSQPEVPVNLEFDTSLAGNGKLEATCQGSRVGEVATEIVLSGDNQCKVSFIPPEPDLYELSVLWSGQHVNGSPFKINTLKDPSSKVKVISLPTATLEYETPLTFAFNVREAETGLMEATCSGENSGEMLCKVGPVIDDVIQVTFTPLQPDVYTLIVKWSGVEVTGSPFIVNLHAQSVESVHAEEGTTLQEGLSLDDILGKDSDPSKCKVLGLQEIDAKLYSELTFNVDCQESGNGELTAYAEYPPTAEAQKQVTVDKKDSQMFTISYTPTVSGMHKIHMMWDGQALPNSPITIEVPSEHKSFQHGNAVQFDISSKGMKSKDISPFAIHKPTNEQLPMVRRVVQNVAERVRLLKPPSSSLEQGAALSLLFTTSRAGDGKLHASCAGNKSGKVNCKVTTTKDETPTADVSFVPPQPDIYHVEVKWSGTHVPGSPFKINLLPPVADNVEVVAKPETVVESGAPVDLDFDTSAAGSGELVATCQGSRTGEVPVTVTSSGIDKYKISFTPPEPDTYEVSVKWAGEHVKGSPFKINTLRSGANKVTVISLPSATLEFGSHLTLGFNVSKAGEGTMEATCNGEKSGRVHCDVEVKPDNKVNVSFIPSQEDLYNMDVTWSGISVPGSPFKINLQPPAVDNVQVDTSTDPVLRAGVPVDMIFDVSSAGSGQLDVSCIGNKIGNVPVKVTSEGENKHKISFTPSEPDLYELSVKWGGEHVSGSPFRFDMLQPVARKVRLVSTPVTSIESGAALCLGFDTSEAGEGVLEVTCAGERCGHVNCLVERREDDKDHIDVSFVPPQPDVYHVNITWSGEHIPGSPFKINLPPIAEMVAMTAEPQPVLEAGVSTDLVSIDTSGAGGGELDAICIGDKVGQVPVEVISAGDDKYKILFTPPEPDMYEFSVKWGGEHIKGSPFKINMLQPAADKVKLVSTPSASIESGAALGLGFDTSKAGKGNMEASCVGDKSGPLDCVVQQHADNKNRVDVSFVPPQPDVYHLQVKWSSADIPGSPFKINLLSPIATKVEMVTQLPVIPTAGAAVDLDFDASQAGSGELNATCVGSKSGEVPVVVQPNSDDKYKIVFMPPEPDSYEVSVKWAGEHVKGSPFIINTRPDPIILEEVEAIEEELLQAEMELLPDICDKDEDRYYRQADGETVKPSVYHLGQVFQLTLNSEAAEESDRQLNVNCSGQKTGRTNVDVFRNSDNIYTIKFEPTMPDIYTLTALMDNKHIPGSPFVIQFLTPVDPTKCRVIGLPTVQPQVYSAVRLAVDCTKAGSAKLTVSVESPSGSEEPSKLYVNETSQGQYSIEYIPTVVGVHKLHINWDDQPIPLSPVLLDVASQKFPHGSPISMDIVGGEAKVDCTEAGIGELSIRSSGPSSVKGQASFNVLNNKDGTYSAVYVPTIPGEHVFDILWSGKAIKDSPLRLHVFGGGAGGLVDHVMQQHVDDENISLVPQHVSEEIEVIENEPIQAAVKFLPDLNDESENRNYSRATMTVNAENCSGVNCSDAKETIRSNYNNLTNLSIDSILGELYAKKVITSTEKQMIETSRLRKDKMAYFLDHVIIPSLDSNFIVKFQRFLEVMNDSDDLMFINMANQLGFTPPATLQTQDETDFGNSAVKQPKPKPELTKDKLKESYTNCFSGNIKEKKNKDDITDLKDPKYKVLIQTVYDYEFYAAMMQLKGHKATRYIGYDPVCKLSSYYYVGEWGEVPVVIVQIAMSRNGPHSSWYETKKALHFMRHLEHIFAVGVCGGVPAKINLGNVIVSKIICGYNDIKMKPTGWNHTVYALNTETDAYHQFTHADGIAQQQGTGIIVKPGVVLSGVWLIADAKLQKDLLNIAPQVIAFEMEGANIVQACGRGKAECLIVKGVSDLAGESKDDDWEPQAATNAAMYLNDEMNKAIHIFTTD